MNLLIKLFVLISESVLYEEKTIEITQSGKYIHGKYKNGKPKTINVYKPDKKINGRFVKYVRDIFNVSFVVSWIVKYADNISPCIDNNLLTMWCCKPDAFHRNAKVGDIYVGFLPTNKKPKDKKHLFFVSYIFVVENTKKVFEYLRDNEYKNRTDWSNFTIDDNDTIIRYKSSIRCNNKLTNNRTVLMSTNYKYFPTGSQLPDEFNNCGIRTHGYRYTHSWTGESAKKIRKYYDL